jgi:hypothetical protein
MAAMNGFMVERMSPTVVNRYGFNNTLSKISPNLKFEAKSNCEMKIHNGLMSQ